MNILGIETSCDETGVAVINDRREVLSHLVLSQIDTHQVFGGVVPEIAARAHLDHLDHLILEAMKQAKLGFSDLDGIAATCGPGLIGGVMVGMMAGKAIALAHNKPFLAVNHLEAHALTPRLVKDIPFPYLVLLVSGGHTQILVAEDIGHYHLWASTRDDAVGECFDKSAKMMGLPYPGGSHLEKLAQNCTDLAAAKEKYPFSIPMKGSKEIEFSFSGLKTAMRQALDKEDHTQQTLADLAASFQSVLAETLAYRSGQAMKKFKELYPQKNDPALIVCGGVSANKTIRATLESCAAQNDFTVMAPPMEYCTDNGAMIAWAGIELLKAGRISPLSTKARPRWPLEELKDFGT
ncbi:MAG: tRNA (adenosine(37)-N6)-threonylcarbamoyltransferase complex transferase subunit TsaD [Alphaproteobacteria bacterium]|jgi:N6-L-threonylcarbamoyladenine synthase|nr:tRNA (adenosine(37)-N6)-threonylcarbamoyltransferase complex transferase subunit TsaD [Alphaproteobacteria bacterium]MCB1550685.1 tRNA (adenosine(37)-N6)-threonylcarbamoyltransferase complex transferase subunit TsaD [Alphaproteobacteria bacterium]MCB9985350.1 tRNA (adenosine(37)-N6)-threonylcarbamoyltransferase complex transferase subunit TsaD [Micavibrio sp.]HRK98130.1 tRNA (adenosine(37)-N6)-threonylcarbamoyltransferase complex transferase subunit TsaD [Alphaproteobacteria bacterium]